LNSYEKIGRDSFLSRPRFLRLAEFGPRSIVYHDVDWSRLTEEYFKQRHELQGRSRAIYKQSSVLSSFANLLRAALGWCWYAALRNERKIYRSKGRVYHYRAMLKEAMRRTAAAPISPQLDQRRGG